MVKRNSLILLCFLPVFFVVPTCEYNGECALKRLEYGQNSGAILEELFSAMPLKGETGNEIRNNNHHISE